MTNSKFNKTLIGVAISSALLLSTTNIVAADLATFEAGTPAKASEVNGNFEAINSEVAANAAALLNVTTTPGPQGAVGPVGSTGAAGPQGEVGAIGPEGAIGPQGEVGATGPEGAVGPQGEVGAAGSEGAVGPQGEVGATGQAGAVGPQGEVGATGPTGAVGPQGEVGATGPTGAAGPQGDVGATGAQGISGVLAATTETVEIHVDCGDGDGESLQSALNSAPPIGPLNLFVEGVCSDELFIANRDAVNIIKEEGADTAELAGEITLQSASAITMQGITLTNKVDMFLGSNLFLEDSTVSIDLNGQSDDDEFGIAVFGSSSLFLDESEVTVTTQDSSKRITAIQVGASSLLAVEGGSIVTANGAGTATGVGIETGSTLEVNEGEIVESHGQDGGSLGFSILAESNSSAVFFDGDNTVTGSFLIDGSSSLQFFGTVTQGPSQSVNRIVRSSTVGFFTPDDAPSTFNTGWKITSGSSMELTNATVNGSFQVNSNAFLNLGAGATVNGGVLLTVGAVVNADPGSTITGGLSLVGNPYFVLQDGASLGTGISCLGPVGALHVDIFNGSDADFTDESVSDNGTGCLRVISGTLGGE